MSDDHVHVLLELAPDEPKIGTLEAETSLCEFDRRLTEAGLNPLSVTSLRLELKVSLYDITEYMIPLAKMTAPVAGVIVAWLHGRAGRKIKFKVDDVLIEATKHEDVEALVKYVSKIRKSKPSSSQAKQKKKGGPAAG